MGVCGAVRVLELENCCCWRDCQQFLWYIHCISAVINHRQTQLVYIVYYWPEDDHVGSKHIVRLRCIIHTSRVLLRLITSLIEIRHSLRILCACAIVTRIVHLSRSYVCRIPTETSCASKIRIIITTNFRCRTKKQPGKNKCYYKCCR